MLLKLKIDLAPLKSSARQRIDTYAEALRGRFITLGAGQSHVYAEKERQAELVSADAHINPAVVPYIQTEAELYGVSLLDAATAVLIKANEWRNVSPIIESGRLAAKEAIGVAISPKEIEQLEGDFRQFCETF
ncbi:hypothetical protein FHV99_004689 [Ochrobactrum sp. P20RRXII]|nr:hypothetical protein [Ochrobactrum sp. P20RRXII]NIH77437.1 hypothetical protein [Ochrobactrum sp. P20RRXII]